MAETINGSIEQTRNAKRGQEQTLRIAGINHFDPTMRSELIQWLNSCSKRFGTPKFIAVEWDNEVFDGVRAERQQFRRLLAEAWQWISKSHLDTLTISLGYEADAHSDIYPDVEVLWLDQGRVYPKDFVAKCAKNRLKQYEGFLQNWPTSTDNSNLLLRIRQRASNVPPPQADARDKKWTELIKARLCDPRDSWAIAIVCSDHARAGCGSMRHLDEQMGFHCEV